MIEQTSAYIPADAAVSAPPAGLLLSYEQLAKEIGVAVPTLYEWVRKGRIPSPIYLGSIPRFTRAVAQQLLERGTDPDGTHEVRSSKRREAIIDGIAAKRSQAAAAAAAAASAPKPKRTKATKSPSPNGKPVKTSKPKRSGNAR